MNDLGEPNKLPWLSVGFTIGGIALIMPYGKLYALFDNKRIYITSTVIFLVGSALCGGAPTMNAEIVGRVIAGIGGNGMYLGLLNIMSANTTDKERPTYLSLTGLCWGAGTVLGPVVGGGFELYTWRWAFYINLLFGAILLVCYVFVLPSNDPSEGKTVWQRLASIDWLGAVMSCAGFTFLVMAINFGGVIYPWRSATVIVLFVLAGVMWILFGTQQSLNFMTSKTTRMFPVHLLSNAQVLLLFTCGAVGGFMSELPVYYTPIFFQFARGDSAILAAVRLLPNVCVLIFVIVLSGMLQSKFGYYKPWYVGGAILNLIGTVLMSRVTLDTGNGEIYGWEILMGAGTGAFVQASFSVIQTMVEPHDIGYAITLMLIAQLSGISFGLSIAGAIYINRSVVGLEGLLSPQYSSSQLQEAVSGTSNGFINSLPDVLGIQALDVIVGAFQDTFIQGYAVCALCLICTIFIKNGKVT